MKSIIVLYLFLLASFAGNAQTDSLKPYEKNRSLPDFSLLNIDSVLFTPQVLAKDKNIIVMLFSPDCSHCQKQLDELLSIGEVARNTELLMISFMPLEFNRIFYQKNKLEKYPYVYLGKDYKGFCISFYKPHTVPVLVFYNKKREFVSINYGNMDKAEILKALEE